MPAPTPPPAPRQALPEDRIAHLGMIQAVIARMAEESARMKQFALATMGIVASTAEATGSWPLALVGLALTLVFWGLDAQYLRQERRFRAHYDHVRQAPGPTDFAMAPTAEPRAGPGLGAALAGWSTAWVYGALALVALGLALSIAAQPPAAPAAVSAAPATP